ncbi:MAG: glycosyltransferase family 2 protein, partial [Alphaproteobacteria bacterium]
MSRRLPGLSASFPAHDEEDNVGPMIEDLLGALPDFADRFEVIAVDDGSRDRTFERASAVAAKDPRVRVVRHEVNRGYGAAVWTGLTSGTMPFAFFTDGDRQFDVRQLGDLVAHRRRGRGRRMAGRSPGQPRPQGERPRVEL